MEIKFIRGTFHLGYAYRAGDTAGSLPDDVVKMLVEGGYAVPAKLKTRLEPKAEEVITPIVKRTRKK